MVELYLVCRDCKEYQHVGVGFLDNNTTLRINKEYVDTDTILEFLAKHNGHSISLLTEYQFDAEEVRLWRCVNEDSMG